MYNVTLLVLFSVAFVLYSQSVHVLNLSVGDERCHIPRPKTRLLQFSPLGTYVAIWEPYAGW